MSDLPHLEMKKTKLYFDAFDGERVETRSMLHCQKIDSFLYPPKVEYKGNAIELGDATNQPMKKECEFYSGE